jgi:hypothetical protein
VLAGELELPEEEREDPVGLALHLLGLLVLVCLLSRRCLATWAWPAPLRTKLWDSTERALAPGTGATEPRTASETSAKRELMSIMNEGRGKRAKGSLRTRKTMSVVVVTREEL